MLGASAGSLLTYIQDRAIINRYKQELERASLLSDIGESLLTDIAGSKGPSGANPPKDSLTPIPDINRVRGARFPCDSRGCLSRM